MTFDELKLCMAIRRARLGSADRPTQAMRIQAALAVMTEWLFLFETSRFPWEIDDIERWRLNLRKSRDTSTKTDIALKHGHRCFWIGREKGPCSEDVEAGHLVARCNGGPLTVPNAIIECRAHNNQRRTLTIEEYLLSLSLTG